MSLLAKSRTLKEILAEYEWEMPTSFIDVVFLLLIFFMCCSSFHAFERRLDAFLPHIGPGIPPPPPPPPLPELVIHVRALDAAGGTAGYEVFRWQTSDPNALAAKLAEVRERKVQVVIDGAEECPFRHVMAALDACARANFTNVTFRPPPTGSL